MFTIATQQAMAATSRVWIYASNRTLTEDEVATIKEKVTAFTQQWKSHGQDTVAVGDVLHQHFIVLMADETTVDVGGCSIDSSVQFVKHIEAELGINLFDRMVFYYQDEAGNTQAVNRGDFKALYLAGTINDQTLVFDTLVKNKQELENNFLKPIKESWHARMV